MKRVIRHVAHLGMLPAFLLMAFLEWIITFDRWQDADFWDIGVNSMRVRSGLIPKDKRR